MVTLLSGEAVLGVDQQFVTDALPDARLPAIADSSAAQELSQRIAARV